MPATEGPLVRHCFRGSHCLKIIYRQLRLWFIAVSRLLLQIRHLPLVCGRRRRILLRRRRCIRGGRFCLGTEREERREALLSRIQRLYALSKAVALARMAPRRVSSSLDNHPGLCRALPDHLEIVVGEDV